MTYSQLDTYKATLAHEQHEDTLFYTGFTPDLSQRIYRHLDIQPGESLGERLGMFIPVSVNPFPLDKPDVTELEKRFSRYYTGVEKPTGSYLNGYGVLHTPGSMYHFTHIVSPLRNAESLGEIEALKYYPGYGGYNDSNMATQVQKAHEKGLVTSCFVGHLYEDAWQIRGYESFLSDMVLNPENCEYILDRILERNLCLAEAAAKAGVDVIRTGDDVANQNTMMFSPDIWRHFIKKRWAKVYETVRRIKPDIAIWYHSDGNITEIIPELIEIGVTILNPLQPECIDIYKVKSSYGKHLVFDGTIGTQTTMPFGTTEEVRRVVADRKEHLGRDGALILSPTHVLEPEVSLENILAFCESCRKNDE